ncbi:MAG: response regulator [Chloroflexota bacterium]
MPDVLIVDDDAASREILADILSYNGLQVHPVASGEDALEVLSEHPFDAVIIDLRLPGIDGWTLREQIHQVADIPCIAITVYNNPAVRQESEKVGFAAYFEKPVDPLRFGQDVMAILS